MRKFLENVNLAEFSNYKIGGPARFFFESGDIEEIKEAVLEAKKRKLKLFILGGGTNLLISDKGYDGLVLKPNINFLSADDGGIVRTGAGVLMQRLLDFAAERGLGGLEWAGGLPGTVGGAIRGNAGAFGGEIKDVVASVESLDLSNLKIVTRSNADCRFAYRSSVFKERDGKEIILSAVLALNEGCDPKKISRSIDEKIKYRRSRHPIYCPNIGSIFKNVALKKVPKKLRSRFSEVIKTDPMPVVPAAHLISEVGLRGVSCGGAMISPEHPNFIVNILDAKASDVKKLIKLVKSEVDKKFGIKLEEEIMEI
jgi:UDP-N-acetylmuramate dehydrogenase